MLTTAVESTALETVVYDDASQMLWLEFRSHAVYCYFAVPASVHHALLEADSKGAFFNQRIRGRFSYRKTADQEIVSPPPRPPGTH